MFHLSEEEKELSVSWFKDLLRFRTVSFEGPENGEYTRCVQFLQKLCKQLIPTCDTEVLEYVTNKPVLLVTIKGTQDTEDTSSELATGKGILLNSHYDVVPVMREHWEVEPFEAVEKEGKIYARGTQDMKCVCIQYILALAKVINSTLASPSQGKELKRTVYLTFVPDEEIGGFDGMKTFIDSDLFQNTIKPRVGIAFDEGLANPKDKYTVFYGERMPLWINVTAKGPTGHGSRFIENTAVEKLMGLARKALDLRQQQKEIFENGGHVANEEDVSSPAKKQKSDENEGGEKQVAAKEPNGLSHSTGPSGCSHSIAKKLGDVLTLNLTMLKAGVKAGTAEGDERYALNVIPTEAKAGFDVRVPVTMPLRDVYALFDQWTAQEGLEWGFATKDAPPRDFEHCVTEVEDNSPHCSPFWKEFRAVCNELNIELETEIFPAGTDSRFIRQAGLPAFGFSPMRNSPILLHEHNEYLGKDVFCEGVEVYANLLYRLANI